MRDLLEKFWVTTFVGMQSQCSEGRSVNYRNEMVVYFTFSGTPS